MGNMVEKYSEVEALLYEYPEIVSEINLKLADHLDDPPICAADYTKERLSPTNRFFSIVESRAFEDREWEPELKKLLHLKRKIEIALDCISKRQYRVLCLRYFDKMYWSDIAAEMSCDSSTVQRYKKQALRKLLEVGLLESVKKNRRNVS